MDMDRERAAIVLKGLREKHRALASASTDLAGIHRELLAALDVALEALGDG